MDENNAIDVVEHLIERCRDGQNGFQEAAEKVKRADLKSFFIEVSAERKEFAEELQAELARLGKPEKKVSGTAEGALHRAWVDIKSTITGMDEAAVLAECERGEDVAKKAYEGALSKDLPADVRAIVE